MKLFIWKAAVFYYTALDIKAVWATHRHNLVFHHTCIEYFNDFGNNSFCILYFFFNTVLTSENDLLLVCTIKSPTVVQCSFAWYLYGLSVVSNHQQHFT
jgi:hypothetical protein